ncbi:MAG: M14/M99 family metallopeptidase [Pseudomonadota bacterium]
MVALLPAFIPARAHAAGPGGAAHEIHFKGTESELSVVHIKGRLPGPTLLIVGGIQGDEPGGYLAADLYADLSLKRGSLILVPRANFLAIVKNSRGVNGDMNRKFAPGPSDKDVDLQVVGVIKSLMAKSDFFLNLHDGSGYYSPKWESPLRNPMRFGQSIIADSEEYKRADGKVLKLGEIARAVINRVNPQIPDRNHVFRFNNHRTLDPKSPHKEQTRSATFHALTNRGIPSFGIETSKEISDYRLRVRYQTMVINAFLEEFGILPEQPKIYLDNPYLKYLIASVNNGRPIVVSKEEVLRVQKGDRLRLVHIESNYTRGLTAQFTGLGPRFNDLNEEVVITGNTAIEVRKDRFLIAEIPVEVMNERTSRSSEGVHFEPRVQYFCVRVEDKTYMVRPGEELEVVKGDVVEILDPKTNLESEEERHMRLDLRGFQADGTGYPVEDRAHLIQTDRELRPEYGRPRGKATVYPLLAKLHKKVFGQCDIVVVEPELEYVVLRTDNGGGVIAYPGDKLELPSTDVLKVSDIRTNVPDRSTFFLTMSGQSLRWDKRNLTGIDGSKLPEDAEAPLDVTRNGRSLGRIWVKRGKEFRLTSSGGANRNTVVPARF